MLALCGMEVAHSRWLIIFAIAAATACAADDTTTSKPPHIIFMVADDMGHADVGFTGASDDVRTPNIDALAAAGVTLQQHYVQPVCSPTRTSILTGRYPIRYGLLHHVVCHLAEAVSANPETPMRRPVLRTTVSRSRVACLPYPFCGTVLRQ